jgi:hypothetical protein
MSNHVYSARLNVTLSHWCQLVPLFETISVRTIRQKRFNQTQVEIVDAPHLCSPNEDFGRRNNRTVSVNHKYRLVDEMSEMEIVQKRG